MHIVQDQIWGRVTANRSAGKATWCYLDEFHSCSRRSRPRRTASRLEAFQEMGRCANRDHPERQGPAFLPRGGEHLENSDFIYMLNQAAGDREILASRLGISPHQLSYVTHSGEGEGLLFYGNVILPFVDHFPRDTELYRLLTTKPGEVRKEEKA